MPRDRSLQREPRPSRTDDLFSEELAGDPLFFERRARGASDYLVSLGVAADRLKTVSYGKEVPVCQQSNEECWSRNRRDHFAVTGKAR